MSGDALIRAARHLRPDLKGPLISGSGEKAHPVALADDRLTKPFTMGALTARVSRLVGTLAGAGGLG